MSFFKLGPSLSHRLHNVEDVIFGRDEDGQPKVIGKNVAADLTDEEASKLRNQGHQLVEASEEEAQEQQQIQQQQVGSDVLGMSPVVSQSQPGSGQVEVDQQGQQAADKSVEQQNQTDDVH